MTNLARFLMFSIRIKEWIYTSRDKIFGLKLKTFDKWLSEGEIVFKTTKELDVGHEDTN